MNTPILFISIGFLIIEEENMINFKEDSELNILNHSCAHLMAQAIKHLYPQAKFWVGRPAMRCEEM